MSALRRVEVVRPFLGQWFMEVCAEADCEDEELLAFANAEHGTEWGCVVREMENGLGPVKCIHDPRRTHFVLVWGGKTDGRR